MLYSNKNKLILESPRFDFVLLPCPDKPRKENGKFITDQYDASGYLGSDDRLLAGAEILNMSEVIFLIGGSCEKVRSMMEIINKKVRKYRLKKGAQLVRVVSDADSLGNLRAWKKFLEEYDIDYEKKRLGILTNFYHMPRVILQAADIFKGIHFTPLIAEAIITKKAPDYLVESYLLLKRLHNELNGIRDWVNKCYDKQDITDKKKWEWEPHDKLLKNKHNRWVVEMGF